MQLCHLKSDLSLKAVWLCSLWIIRKHSLYNVPGSRWGCLTTAGFRPRARVRRAAILPRRRPLVSFEVCQHCCLRICSSVLDAFYVAFCISRSQIGRSHFYCGDCEEGHGVRQNHQSILLWSKKGAPRPTPCFCALPCRDKAIIIMVAMDSIG